MPKLRDLLSKENYEDIDPDFILANRDGFIKEVRGFLEGISRKALRAKAESRILDVEMSFGPMLDNGPDSLEKKSEYKIKENYLKILEGEDAINKFSISTEIVSDDTGPEDIVVVKIKLNPRRFLDVISEKNFRKPKYLRRDGFCFLDFGKGVVVKIGEHGSRPCRLLEMFSKPNTTGGSIEGVFEHLTSGKNTRSNEPSFADPRFRDEKKMKTVIENAIREIRRKLSGRGLHRKIDYNFELRTIWIYLKV